MPWASTEELPSGLRKLSLEEANHWGRIFDALKADGHSEESAAKIAWYQLRGGKAKNRIMLRKGALAMFPKQEERAATEHPPLSEKGDRVLLRSTSNPRVRRWQRTSRQGAMFHGEHARRVLSEAMDKGQAMLTRARAEHPEVRALVDSGHIELHPEPAHHAFDFRATLTDHGRRSVKAARDTADRERKAAQSSLFKGGRMRLGFSMRKAKQIGLFGGAPHHHAAEPTREPGGTVDVKQHIAKNPGGHGTHFVHEHHRHFTPGAPVTAGQRVAGESVTVTGKPEPETMRTSVQKRRGQTFHELGTTPGQWRPADIESFAEVEADKGELRAMPVWEKHTDHKPVTTRFSGGTSADDMACELCGAKIKDACLLLNDEKGLSMNVGNKCIEDHADALMPESVKAIRATFALKVKPAEVREINELMREGTPAQLAVARVRARHKAGAAFDRKHPVPHEDDVRWWDRQRAEVARIAQRRREGEFVSPASYNMLRDPNWRDVEVELDPLQLRDYLDTQGSEGPEEGTWIPPRLAAWTEAQRAVHAKLGKTYVGWDKAPDVKEAARAAFFARGGIPKRKTQVPGPKYAHLGEQLHVTRARLRGEEVDAAEREAMAKHHPDVVKIAALHELTSAGKTLEPEDQAWVDAKLAEAPASVRTREVRGGGGFGGHSYTRVPIEGRNAKATALLTHLTEVAKMQPLRKAAGDGAAAPAPVARTPKPPSTAPPSPGPRLGLRAKGLGARTTGGAPGGLVAPPPKPPPQAKPPGDSVAFHHPETGEQRTGKVIAGGAKGVTVVDHETGLAHKVAHGHYVEHPAPKPPKPGAGGTGRASPTAPPALPKPGPVPPQVGQGSQAGDPGGATPAPPDYRATHPGLAKYPPKGVHAEQGPEGGNIKLQWRSPTTGKMVQSYETSYLRDNAREKFTRIGGVAQKLNHFRETAKAHMAGAPGQSSALATMARIIDHTAARPGNESSAAEGVHGISTLKKSHVKVDGDRVKIAYSGKDKIPQEHEVHDPAVAANVRHLLSLPGDRLFQHVDHKGETRPLTAAHVNDYIARHMGEDHSAKDLRTFHATRIFSEAADKLGPPKNEADGEEKIQQAALEVAKQLGHRKAVNRREWVKSSKGGKDLGALAAQHGGAVEKGGLVGFKSARDRKAFEKAHGEGLAPAESPKGRAKEYEHEPSTSLNNYIDPTVIAAYRKGLTLSGGMRKAEGFDARHPHLDHGEHRFLDYLDRVEKLDPYTFRGAAP